MSFNYKNIEIFGEVLDKIINNIKFDDEDKFTFDQFMDFYYKIQF